MSTGSAASRSTASTTRRSPTKGLHHGSSYIEHVRFLDAVRTGGRAEVTLDDGLWSVAMGVAAHRSIELGRPVAMSELLPATRPVARRRAPPHPHHGDLA